MDNKEILENEPANKQTLDELYKTIVQQQEQNVIKDNEIHSLRERNAGLEQALNQVRNREGKSVALSITQQALNNLRADAVITAKEYMLEHSRSAEEDLKRLDEAEDKMRKGEM